MKCLVCGKNYEAVECPRCGFPDIQIVGSPEDRKKALDNLKPTIHAYRTRFLGSIKVELATYRWMDRDGTVVLDREAWILLGSGGELLKGETWLEEPFARIADQKSISVTIRITIGNDVLKQSVTIPNLTEPELQQLGASLDSDCNLRLLLKNTTQAPASSDPIPLFA